MMRVSRDAPFVLTGTSPAAAGKAVMAIQRGLARYNMLRIDAVIQGATGGLLDLYLQRRIQANLWADWLHFPQLGAGAASGGYTAVAREQPSDSLAQIGTMSDDLLTGAFVLTAGVFLGGLPADAVRLVANAGASTSAGAVQTVYLTGFEFFS